MRWNFRIQSTKIQILKITFCKPILLRLYTCLPASPIKHALTKKTNYFYVVTQDTKKGLEIGLKWWEQRSFERIWAPFFERFYALYEIVFQCYPCIWTYSLEGFVFLRIISKWLRYLILMIMYPIRSFYLEMSRSNQSDSFNKYNFLKSNRTLMELYDLLMIESL